MQNKNTSTSFDQTAAMVIVIDTMGYAIEGQPW
jgi:hypothetical protein